jgi:hypothetical protein
MIGTSKDMALEALLEAASVEAPNMSIEFIKAIYQVEKVHQFSPEDKGVIDELQKLIDDELSSFQRGAQ